MRPDKRIGIFLAAGRSTRMGSDKLRLPLGARRLGNYALAAALDSCLDYVYVISNDGIADWIDRALYREPIHQKWSVLCCPEARLGQAHSLQCGIQAAISMDAGAAMILLADQPCITTEMIDTLLMHFLEERENNNMAYAASRYQGLARPPVIFDRRLFPDLLRLSGDQGARQLIRKEKQGVCVDFTNPDLFMDVDTREDYSSLLNKVEGWKS